MFRPWVPAILWELTPLLACAACVSSYMVGIRHVIKIIITKIKLKFLISVLWLKYSTKLL